jgi:uncharacterized protein YuzE
MRRRDDPRTGSLYGGLKTDPVAAAQALADGLNIDIDAAGAVIGLVINHASQKLDLTTLGTESLPFRSLKAA